MRNADASVLVAHNAESLQQLVNRFSLVSKQLSLKSAYFSQLRINM